MAALVAIDFDALVKPPEPSWWTRGYEWLRVHRWTRRLYVWGLPWALSRYTLSREADMAGWWLVNNGLRIVVIVRCPYAVGITKAVEHVLGEFPNDLGGFHLVSGSDVANQSMDINQFCRGERVLRFYTRDKELAKYLPTSLVRVVDQWDDSLLQ